jgi:uncharacterized protein
MKLDRVRMSTNVEDRRGARIGGRRGIALGGGTLVLVAIIAVVAGKNPLEVLASLDRGAQQGTAPGASAAPVDPNDPGAVFVKKILATTEDTWQTELPKLGARYQEPKLVLYRDAVESACGFQKAAVGPFYCPGDAMAYFDLDFLDALQNKLGARGDFASAYVIAHEIGHHVQKLLGTSSRARAGGQEEGAGGSSVRLELQADCYAGVWGAYAKKQALLETGDVEEALGAANAIGDDTLQRRGTGRVTPETFSHGTSAQRVRWFKRGMETGDPKACDTFQTAEL